MKIIYTSKFARAYKKLPEDIKIIAEKKEKVFRKNPHDTRLKTHKLKGDLGDLWSFSVSYQIRIIFEFADNDIVYFHTVGQHDIYD